MSNIIVSHLASTKVDFLTDIDSRIVDKSDFRIVREVSSMFEQFGKEKVTKNERIMLGYSEAKKGITAKRIDVLKKEAARIKAAFPIRLQQTKDSEKDLQDAMEKALLRIMYPNGYFVNKVVLFMHKDNERTAFANRLYVSIMRHVEGELLKGTGNGRVFFSDLKTIMGLDKTPDLKTVKTACADIHNANVESIAATSFRSGSCWFDLSFSQSLKKGLAVAWEIHNYE